MIPEPSEQQKCLLSYVEIQDKVQRLDRYPQGRLCRAHEECTGLRRLMNFSPELDNWTRCGFCSSADRSNSIPRGLREKSLKAGCCFANSCHNQLQFEGASLCKVTDSLSLAIWLRSAAAPFPSTVGLISNAGRLIPEQRRKLASPFGAAINARSAGDQPSGPGSKGPGSAEAWVEGLWQVLGVPDLRSKHL